MTEPLRASTPDLTLDIGAPVPKVYLDEVPQKLDGVEAGRFEQYLKGAVACHSGDDAPPTVVVDFAGVEFIDSSGVAALLKGQASAEKAGLRLHVRNPMPIVAKRFVILGVFDGLVGRPLLADVTGANPKFVTDAELGGDPHPDRRLHFSDSAPTAPGRPAP